jgi:hypothetical protein
MLIEAFSYVQFVRCPLYVGYYLLYVLTWELNRYGRTTKTDDGRRWRRRHTLNLSISIRRGYPRPMRMHREERKFPSSPVTAKITSGPQLHFGWGHGQPGNCLSYLKILARYLKFHFWLDSSCYEKRLFSELRTSRRNPYLKAVDYVIHRKLRDSRKTTWFTENYVIHVKLRDSLNTRL